MSGTIRIQEITTAQKVEEAPVAPPNSRDQEVSHLAGTQLQRLQPDAQAAREPRGYAPAAAFAENEDPCAIFAEVFGRQNISGEIPALVYSYLSDEDIACIFDSRLPYQAMFNALHPLTSFVHLDDPDIVMRLLGEKADGLPSDRSALMSLVADYSNVKNLTEKEQKSLIYLLALSETISEIYEVNPRFIANHWGLTFTTYPEVLLYVAELAKGKIAVELGAASGEHAIVLAFAGAKHVYANDLDPIEMARFRELKDKLPRDIGRKLEDIEGNCLDILQKKPSLSGRVDVILCRNVIHFFNDRQQNAFFQVIRNILKPGGRIVISTNSVYSLIAQQGVQWCENNAHATVFRTTQCVLVDESGQRVKCYAQETTSCSESQFEIKHTALDLYKKIRGGSWKMVTGASKKLTEQMRKKSDLGIKENSEERKKLPAGVISVWTNNMRAYTTSSLSNLLKRNGFEIETTFVTGITGHLIEGNGHRLVSQDEFNINALQTGVIARLSG